MDNMDLKKKINKSQKVIFSLNRKITLLSNQIDFIFKNKFIGQDLFIEYMSNLNVYEDKIIELDNLISKKKISKNVLENEIKEIDEGLGEICKKTGSTNCKNILDIFVNINEYLEKKDQKYIEIFELLNSYYIPLSCNISDDIDKFIKKYNINPDKEIIIHKLLETSKNNTLIEKINGCSIIFIINKKIIYINGYLNKDSLHIFKNFSIFKEKMKLILEKAEFLDIPVQFKERYIEQLSLRDFIIDTIDDIINMLKSDYSEFLNYKNKSLSALIKEFIKAPIEKQRRIIILFLISDQEYQFTAHIIFDLITDKSFLAESQYLSEIIFNSLHWKVQQVFKISNENFENSKKKLENLTINNVPYESRILALQTTDNIKARAMEKLKEINGSKDNSVKAQQWLDGFLKIPFGIYKKEPIISFFKSFQERIDNYIELFTIKISEYNIEKLNNKNKLIHSIIIQIIDEYHSNINKSEYSYNNYIKYLQLIKFAIEKELGMIQFEENTNENVDLLSNIIENNIIPNEEVINECIKQLDHFKKIKQELTDKNIMNENNINRMINKLTDLESILNIQIQNEPKEKDKDVDENSYNMQFKKYIIKNIGEIDILINEWNDFKINKKNYIKDVDKILDKCTYGQNDAKKQMKRIIGQWMNGNTKGQCFGLCGPPGVGKTTLCKNGLAKCLFDDKGESRPIGFLPLGGATNGSILEGHHYTYLGSTWGKIVDILMETKCMNPIIYIDELDKISKTEHGKEIISILTHITDQSQNKEYYDRYFSSIPIDLSQVLFIFSYNDSNSLDRILKDRIQEIEIKALSTQEKIVISQNYVIPEILHNVGFSSSEIIFSNDILTNIINKYTFESGCRKLNEILYDVVRDINLKRIEDYDDLVKYPIIIDNDLLKPILSNMCEVTIKKIDGIDRVGVAHGLYCSGDNFGGITMFQAMKTYSDKKLSIEKITGSAEKVLLESADVAFSVAWSIIPDDIKQNIQNSNSNMGIHLHCGDGSTKKDGPSGGNCLCLAFVSILTNTKVRNDVALTGEINLLGHACEIGGLYQKLIGAYVSGIKKVLIPKDNEKDLELIFRKEEEEYTEIKRVKSFSVHSSPSSSCLLNQMTFDENETYEYIPKRYFRNEVEVVIVNNIYDVLKHALVDNDLIFNKIF